MPDRPLAAVDDLGDLRDRSAAINQPFELRPLESPTRRMAVLLGRLQPVFLNPIGDRGFMSAEPLPDCRQRQALTQQLLQ
jgi:hypothetical protein